MKKIVSAVIMFAILTVATISFVQSAAAEELKMIGTITKIEMAADGKSATVILQDNKTSESIPILVSDELTLDKFKDHRIVEGDEIRCKYEVVEGQKVSKLFRKTAGC